MTQEELGKLASEIEKYGFTSKATGEALLAEIRSLNGRLVLAVEEWQLADDDAHNIQEENTKLRGLLAEAKPHIEFATKFQNTDSLASRIADALGDK